MSETLSFTELEAQHVELLPARTVLSLMFMHPKPGGGADASGGNGNAYAHGGVNINHQLSNVGVFNHHGNVISGPQNSFQSADAVAAAVGGNGGGALTLGHGPANASGGDGNAVAIGGVNVNTQLSNVGVVNLGNGNVISGPQNSFQSANATAVGIGGSGGLAFAK